MYKQFDNLKRDIMKVLPGDGSASYGLTFQSICEMIPNIGWCWRMRTDVATCLSNLACTEQSIVRVDYEHEYRYLKKSYKRKWGKQMAKQYHELKDDVMMFLPVNDGKSDGLSFQSIYDIIAYMNKEHRMKQQIVWCLSRLESAGIIVKIDHGYEYRYLKIVTEES